MTGEDTTSATLLLDTHVWVWMVTGQEALFRPELVVALNRAHTERRLALAAISLWEVAMLHEKGRLRLRMALVPWFERALFGVRRVDLTPEIAAGSAALPGELHGDPGDRLIVATARHEGAVLVTRDRRLLAYGEQGHVRVMAM